MNVLSLFSGIGGIDLGLERAGMRVVAQCEIDPFCRAVLAKHWPDVPRFDDVRTLNWHRLPLDIDIIAGGFPCQPFSSAARGRNNAADLWPEMRRLVSEIRPRYVFVENVDAIRRGKLGDVLGDLAAIRFDAEWDSIPAASVGAPHYRSRVWIVARNTDREGEPGCPIYAEMARLSPVDWPSLTDEFRDRDGLPDRMDRLRALGNAVVPQVVEAIGRAIMKANA